MAPMEPWYKVALPRTEVREGRSFNPDEFAIAQAPDGRVAVFGGNAWDPHDGLDTPWLDLAHQLAGDDGVRALGAAAKTAPPGTDALARLFEAAGGRVLVLCDEVLNFMNRH